MKITNKFKFIRFICIIIAAIVVSLCFYYILSSNSENYQRNKINNSETEIYQTPSNQLKLMPSPSISFTFIPIEDIENIDNCIYYDIPLSRHLQKYTWDMCQQCNISYELVLSTLYIESDFNIKVIARNDNGSYDRGIAQVNTTYEEYSANLLNIENFDPFNPYKSIEFCVKLLDYYKSYWLDKGYSEEQIIHMSLSSYNKGLNGYRRFMKQNETLITSYSQQIVDNKISLERDGVLLPKH